MFVQIHMLQSMPPGNLNRDETGQPKKCLFGGVTRGRISSQCLKRNIRQSEQFRQAFGQDLGTRTLNLPQLIADELRGNGSGMQDDEIAEVMQAVKGCFKKEEAAPSTDDESGDDKSSGKEDLKIGMTPQLVFFPQPFAKEAARLLVDFRAKNPEAYDRFLGRKQKATKKEEGEQKKQIEAFKQEVAQASRRVTVDIALFGRMTTSDLVVDVEAACQVAHAISTHETIIESDYFTAMDDLKQEPGAAYLGRGETETFFNSAVYYKYLNADLASLVDEDHLPDMDAEGVGRTAAALLKAAALATPSGKQNSFAAHSVPEFILVEVSRTKRPISFANAFLKPVKGGMDSNLMSESAQALASYIDSTGAAFAPGDTQRLLLQVGPAEAPLSTQHEKAASLDELADKLAQCVKKGG